MNGPPGMTAPPKRKGGPLANEEAAENYDFKLLAAVNGVALGFEAGMRVPITDRSPAVEAAEMDDPEAVAIESIADPMIDRGIDRRLALECAAEIWRRLRAKDAFAAAVSDRDGGKDANAAGEFRGTDSLRERIGLTRFFELIEDEASQGECPTPAQRFVAFVAGCHLAGIPFARGSMRELAPLCGVSHEVLNRRVRRMQARLPELFRPAAKFAPPTVREEAA